MTRASIDHVHSKLEDLGEEPLSLSRFRPNIIISGTGPFEEDSWSEINIGEISIQVLSQCASCLLPNVDTETGIRNVRNQPYKLPNDFRKVDPKQPLKPVLGMHAAFNVSDGQVLVGMEVEALKYIDTGKQTIS